MKILLFISVLILSVFDSSCQTDQQNKKLSKLWETEPNLKIPESVLYDSVSGLVFVSNIDGSPSKKDTAGFISTLSLDGKILQLQWVKGLDAPKGMGILHNHLFVTNIDEIVEIDIATASILNRFPVEGSKFLNDIAIDPVTGMIFITDTSTGEVFVMLEGRIGSWLKDDLCKGANGLFLKGKNLYIGTANSILKADIETGELVITVYNTGSIDGLFVSAEGNIVCSDWSGSINCFDKKHRREVLLNTTDQKVNAADFETIPSKNMILVPTFFNNKVICYTSTLIK